jgi:hypothetical protein
VIHGSGRWTSPASGVPGARAGPGLQHLAHKLRGVDAMLTKGLQRPELAGSEGDWALADRRLQTSSGVRVTLDRLRGLL